MIFLRSAAARGIDVRKQNHTREIDSSSNAIPSWSDGIPPASTPSPGCGCTAAQDCAINDRVALEGENCKRSRLRENLNLSFVSRKNHGSPHKVA